MSDDRKESESDRILALALSGGGITPEMASAFIRGLPPVQSNPAQAEIQPRGDEEDPDEIV